MRGARKSAPLGRWPEGSAIKRELKDAAGAAEDVTNSRALELLARVGFAVSGLLHFLVGAIAIRLAMGGSGNADFSGAVSELASQPAGPFLLWASFAACAALAVWQASDAVFDYNRLPTKDKVGKKAKAAAQAVVFAGLAVTLASFAMGTGSGGDNQQSASDLTVAVMKAPGGVALLVLVGLGMAITGIIYGIRGIKKTFEKHLTMPVSRSARTAVSALGVTGYVAKGIVLLLTGMLISIATLQAHPDESTGLDGGLRALRDQPFGVYLLAAVGAGLICYGLYMVVRARLAKM
ncbi:DUF1206 domain-containing protein [Pseudarthrobacter raffinosi]|uniref:DUF1206 domain-containing protein n=1 Tax=Pseudarthrobacter raffinosi TaxID=2953651 RepID=UPI00208F5715|nr:MULTISPECIES: DUF1206 domain-containing protein [unclassified Pseudarthrobacter]MCO4236791.1 DUF1206 domain-containing protein [Pseudarthrobacter sp. MDT3-28]MCO4250261.1 DUF1206 domain-containing protein [Pseudarthrobacter sp. MDT3-9]MCO4263547.1 DUF1206 domain-containing protein [Pseudarthrobacter sp. MDT3-26]